MRRALRFLLLGFASSLAVACVNRDIVRPAESRLLSVEEIGAALASANFREALNARTQLAGLPDDAWFAVLSPLAHDSLPQHRLLAAIELSRRASLAARQVLDRLAQDPDETVRTEVRERLSAVVSPGGPP